MKKVSHLGLRTGPLILSTLTNYVSLYLHLPSTNINVSDDG